MKKNMKMSGNIMPRLVRIDRKCDSIIRLLGTGKQNGEKVDSLIRKMDLAARELEQMAGHRPLNDEP